MAGLVGLVTALPAAAGTTNCVFEQECLDTEACAETSFELSFTDGAAMTASVTSINGDFDATPIASNSGDVTGFVMLDPDGQTQHLLTVHDSIGRYSIHMPLDGLAIYYLGSCEAE